jgi:predicted 2-oxoglutarate/Fe(II)-dependent dioxygenase YbiX
MKIINGIMQKINPKICFLFNTGYYLRKIYGETRRHIDNINNLERENVNFINKEDQLYSYTMIRNASMIFSLNDNYHGGEFYFPYHEIHHKMKKGSIIIFPPYWTHPHEVSTVTNDTYRYTINTWAVIPATV